MMANHRGFVVLTESCIYGNLALALDPTIRTVVVYIWEPEMFVFFGADHPREHSKPYNTNYHVISNIGAVAKQPVLFNHSRRIVS